MANQTEERIILIRVDASRAVEGSAAATRALERMERAQGQAADSLGRLEKSLDRAAGYIKANLALAIAEIGSRLVAMGKQAFDAAAGLDELAEQLGTNARALQGMQFAAVASGVKMEQLETGLSKFSQKMGEAADGSKDVIESLNALGVKNLDVQGKLRPTEALLQEVAAAITAIDDPARRSAAAVDFFGKTGTKMLPLLGEIAKGSDNLAAAAERAGAMIDAKTIKALDELSDRSAQSSLKVRALFANLGAPIATAALDAVNKVLQSILDNLEALQKKAATTQTRAREADVSNLDEQIARERGALAINPNNKLAQSSLDALLKRKAAAEEAVNRSRILDRQAGMEGDESSARAYKLGVVENAPGVSTTVPKGTGQGEADAIAKLRRDTTREVEAANAYAEASARGAKAVSDLETHFKALKSAQDAYGKTADANKAGVAALTAEIEKQLDAVERLNALKGFNLGTEELEKSNELLAAENRLINESAEVRGREIALIKLRQDVASKGLDASNEKEREAIERRETAITQNERLKAQAEDLRKANELWTAPLKSALESIQRTGADMWEKLLENGKFSAEEFGQIFVKMARRAAAELLALATIRPAIGSVIGGLGSLGLVSPQTASALGYGGSVTGGSGGGFGGGFGGFGGGGFGSMFSGTGIGTWLNTPMMGSWAGISNVGPGMYGPAPNTTSGLGLGGTTWGQGLGALAGAGMGIYSLATAGGNTGKTIGGIASLVGAGVSLIPGIGQIAGPIIGMLGGLLPGLFGGGQQEPPTMRGIGSLDWSGGAWRSVGAGYGGGQAIDLAPVGTSISSLLQGAGVNLGNLTGSYGLRQESISKGDFSAATTFLNGRQWGQGSTEKDIGLDSATATLAHQMMMEVGSGISDTMRVGLSNFGINNLNHVISTKELAQAVSELQSFEATLKSLSQTTTNAEQALAQIDAQFAGLYDTANRYGLGTSGIDAAKNKARSKLGTDFADSIARQLMGGQEGALFDLDKERKDLLETNAAYKAIAGYADQAAKIEELYAKKRADIIEQYASQSTKALAASYQALIDRLTYGDLANASPTTSFSGTRATYLATLAQARAGNSEASARLAGDAEAYANAGRSFFGSSGQYTAVVDQIRRDLMERQDAAKAGSTVTGGSESDRLIAQMRAMQEEAINENRQLREQVAALVAQLMRRG